MINTFRRLPALLTASLPLLLVAQGVQTSSIDGEVRGQNGKPIPGVQVVVTSPALQGQRVTNTDALGRFAAHLLPPGQYILAVSKAGYQTQKVPLTVGLGQGYNPHLVIVPQGEATVAVTAAFSQEVGTSSNFVFQDVDTLPTERKPEDLLVLTPGVTDTQKINGNVSIRGSLTANNKFLIDGQDVGDPKMGNRSVDPIADAIQEVQVITGAIPAEYAYVDGGVVNTITRTGGNEFTGVFRSTLSKDAWSAVQPLQDRSSISDTLNQKDSLAVGGYLLKDKLWFFLAGYQENSSLSKALGSLSSEAGTPYTSTFTDKRLQAKLTYQLVPSQTLTFSYLTNRNNYDKLDQASGDLSALIPVLRQNSSWTLNWAANFDANLAIEARVGQKKEALVRGGTIPGVTPVLDAFAGGFYLNGLWSSQDGGDHRDNTSFDIKATSFFDALGHHQFAFGANVLDETRQAQNYQSPTNAYIVLGRWKPGQTAMPLYLATFQSTDAHSYNNLWGFFVNDRWDLDTHWSFNLGLRADRFHAYSEDSPQSAGATSFSPRLGVKWDPYGDNQWHAAASFSRYSAKPLANIVNAASAAGNAGEIDYSYTGPYAAGPYATQADASNPDNYTKLKGYAVNTLTTRLDPNLKAPHTDEVQLSLDRTYRLGNYDGYVKATLVRREYKDLLDSRIGNDGTVTPPAPYNTVVGAAYIQVWENSDLARRTYKALELESSLKGSNLELLGNITWSSLKGNYQGETSGPGPSGSNLKNFWIQDGTVMYDNNQFNPDGPLLGDVPLRIRATGQYHVDWSWGRTVLGVVYRFDSGAHDSIQRGLSGKYVNAAFAPKAQASTFYQYKDGERGQVVYPSQAYTDLAITQDFRVVRLAGKAVNFFLKATISDLFNHQQIIKFQNKWNSTTSATSLTSPWVPESTNGNPASRNDFGAARTIGLQLGARF